MAAHVGRAAQPDPFFTPEHFERRRRAMAQYSHWQGVDASEPRGPCGHAYELDAADFRGMVQANFDHLQRDDLQRLGGEVWDGGAAEILRVLEIAMRDEPVPV